MRGEWNATLETDNDDDNDNDNENNGDNNNDDVMTTIMMLACTNMSFCFFQVILGS